MNSSLVNYTKLSPNYNTRDRKISKITIHHMACNLTVETCGNIFASSAREASANYGIGSDGIVGLYVEEKNRSWASANRENDMMAVTMLSLRLVNIVLVKLFIHWYLIRLLTMHKVLMHQKLEVIQWFHLLDYI